MKSSHGNFLRSASLALFLAGASAACAQVVYAHDARQPGFGQFVKLNPGIDRGALKQVWSNNKSGAGQSGITFGVIMPGVNKPGSAKPALPPAVSVDNVRAFKNANPGIEKHALRNTWHNANDPGRLGFKGRGGSDGVRSGDFKKELMPFSQFEELNPGIDRDALEKMYELLKGGNSENLITFGVISTPPQSGVPGSTPVVGANAANLLTMPGAYGVSLITSGK